MESMTDAARDGAAVWDGAVSDTRITAQREMKEKPREKGIMRQQYIACVGMEIASASRTGLVWDRVFDPVAARSAESLPVVGTVSRAKDGPGATQQIGH